MSEEVGSMDVVMNYKDNGLQDGMKETKKGLDNAKDSGKSVKQEMMRLNAVSVATGQVVADVAKKFVDMFVGALTSSPYLIGAFTRMKVAVQMLFWELSKYLKPALDLVADGLVALTKGDWSGFKNTISDAWGYFVDILKGTWSWIKEHSPEWVQDVMTWMENTYTVVVEWMGKVKDFLLDSEWVNEGGEGGIWAKFKYATIEAFKWIVDNLLPPWMTDLINGIGEWIDDNAQIVEDTWLKLTSGIPWFEIGTSAAKDFWAGAKEYLFGKSIDFTSPHSGTMSMDMNYLNNVTISGMAATGLYVPSDGIYRLHAGETVNPVGTSSKGGSGGNIVIDFGNSVFNLASGIDIEELANTISQTIADKQAWEAY